MTADQNTKTNDISRRDFGKRVGTIAAASALAGVAIPAVHAAESSTIRIALVGCGGRGTGAAMDALRARGVKPKLVAMADAFKDRLQGSYDGLTSQDEFGERIDVPEERRFIGFDAYKHAMDCLKPGDVAIFATPLAFRWVHFQYAISKGLHVFMEKPLSADGFASRKLIQLAEEAKAKNLKVGVGLMSRHARPLEELQKRIADGAIGDIMLMRGYRMHGVIGFQQSTPKPAKQTELEFQIRRFHSFIWASGGCFNDFNIHIIDHLCCMKNAGPVMAIGVGGRQYQHADDGTPYVDQNFDSYGSQYTCADGAQLYFDGRTINGAGTVYSSHVQGTKGAATASANSDCGAPSTLYKGWDLTDANKTWQSTDNSLPYQNEWNDLMDAIVHDKPYNEVKRGVEASVVCNMGRMAAHTGQEVTFDQALNLDHAYAPDVDKFTDLNSPAPVKADAKGVYPKPEPGKKKGEY
jgi:predicted dehydrogenase